MKKNRKTVYMGLGLTAVLLFLFSCSFLESLKEKSVERENVFNHKIHVVENDMECTDCHAGATAKDRAGMPTLAACLDCHEDPEKGSKVEAALVVLKAREKGGKPLWVAMHKPGELLFSHKTHVTLKAVNADKKKPACNTCHGDVGGATDLAAGVVTHMSACMACHEKGFTQPPQKGVKEAPKMIKGSAMTACSFCHRVWRKDTQPQNHKKLWRVTHGEEIRFGLDEKEMYYCEQCHDHDLCTKCHQQEKPRSHTAFFRTRGHGIEAEISRERCRTCHREDYCVRCHQSTRPRSHSASWGGAPYRHCNSCHLDLASTRCSVCHKASAAGVAQGHIMAGAPVYPRDLTHAGNCTMACHTQRHPDPGPNCKTCHK